MPLFNVLLVDDHAMLRTGLALVIASSMPEAMVFEATSLEQALDVSTDSMAVVLLDIQLADANGIECIAPLKRRWPDVPIVMVSSHTDPQSVRRALECGASVFVSKSEPAARIVDAIRTVVPQEIRVDVSVAGATSARSPTPRQCEVLVLLHQGLSNKAIARRLELSDNTVRRHV